MQKYLYSLTILGLAVMSGMLYFGYPGMAIKISGWVFLLYLVIGIYQTIKKHD